MGDNMGDQDSEAQARGIAAMSGETADEAPGDKVRQRLRQLEGLSLFDAIMEISHHSASLPNYDPRTADEIIGYDEHGLPV